MKKRTAAYLFLGICIILAILLLTHMVSPVIGGGIFALALITIGAFSKGFTNSNRNKAH